jgi:hypothetical protein
MVHRKGAEAPNLGNFAWEFFSKSSDPQSSDHYAMSCRPIFVLSDAFKRVNNLPKKKLSSLPPTLSPSDMINFHKLALRYSKNLTKDIIFSGFRDIVRKIGEIVAANKRIKLAFSVGTLVVVEKNVTFEFDLDALKLDNNGGGNTVVFTMEKPDVFKEEKERIRREEEEGGEKAAQEEAAAAEAANKKVSPRFSETGYLESDDADYAMESNVDTMMESAKASGSGPFMVQEEAYSRYIKLLENDAVGEDYQNKTIQWMQKEKDRLWDEKVENKKRRAKELQNEILGTIAEREMKKKEEVVLRKVKTETSFYPKVDREGGVLAANETTRDLGPNADTYGVPVSRKFKGLPSDLVSKKGTGFRVGEGELLESLRMQMAAKDNKKREEREMRLEEEKRYIDHINMELDYETHAKQLEGAAKKDTMLQAWERERFLKHMQKLRLVGDIEGLRTHKLSGGGVGSGGGGGRGGGGGGGLSGNQGDSARANAIAAISARSGFGDAQTVGFDSRK